MNSDERARLLGRLVHGRGDIGAERPAVLYAAVVVAGGVPVEAPVQRPTPELVRTWMTAEYDGRLVEGQDYWIIPAGFGGL